MPSQGAEPVVVDAAVLVERRHDRRQNFAEHEAILAALQERVEAGCEPRWQVTHAVEVPTRDLNQAESVAVIFKALGLAHMPLTEVGVKNTNAEAGRGATVVTAEDVRVFERFMNRLPAAVVDRLGYLKSYRPRAAA